MTGSCRSPCASLGVLLLLVKPLGSYMALVFADTPNKVLRFGHGTEKLLYRLCGIDSQEDMGWRRYAIAMLAFNLIGLLVVYLLQRVQPWLPLNPQHFATITPDSAMNTAISFASNTNWQGYGGESTMSYLTQMLGLAVQNFVSAATGMAILLAVIRGFTRRSAKTVGNFWVDMTRSTLYVLVPLSLVLALLLVSQGVVQNFKSYVDVPVVQTTTMTEAAQRCRRQSGAAIPRANPKRRTARSRHRRCRWVRLPRRSRSSSWVPMVVVSSAPTRHIRTRIRRR